MTFDIGELLSCIDALRSPGVRIGLPDDPTALDVGDPPLLARGLHGALCAFRDLRGGADYLVRAEVNTYHRQVWVRFVQRGPCRDHNVTLLPCDRADLPLEAGTVDALFATNALPRASSAERVRVLRERVRVVRPGGQVLIAQHNFFDSDVEPVLRDAGWVEVNILGGERQADPAATGFQIRYSSG